MKHAEWVRACRSSGTVVIPLGWGLDSYWKVIRSSGGIDTGLHIAPGESELLIGLGPHNAVQPH